MRQLASYAAFVVFSLLFSDWRHARVDGAILLPPASNSSSSTCNPATDYYDTAVLGCNRCIAPVGGAAVTNTLLTPDMIDANVLGLASSCTCANNAYFATRDDSVCASAWPAPCNLHVCTSCPTNQAATRDAARCLPCGKSTQGFDKSSNECKCPTNSLVVEKSNSGEFLSAKECVACASGTRYDSVSNTCAPCEDPAMIVVNNVCTCASGYQFVTSELLAQSACVAQTRITILSSKVNLNLASTVTFSAFKPSETGSRDMIVSFASALVEDMFLLAASGCYFYETEKQNQHCQALGNLCVFQHMRPTAPPCALIDLIQRSGRVTTANSINGWFYTLPFLHYQANAESILTSTSIGMKMSFDEVANTGTNDHLEFILASYSVNGTLKGFRRLTNELLYCVDSTATIKSPLWTRFGVGATTEFRCDLSLVTLEMMELYELYLVDKSRDEGDDQRNIPIPIQNLNYQDERGLDINDNERLSDQANDVLTHRFFLLDVATGVKVGEKKTKVSRYADSITLTVRAQRDNVDMIYTPVLSISYVDTQQIPTSASVTFQVIYSSDTTGFRSSALTFFVIMCILAGARIILHTFTWQRRNTRNEEMAITALNSVTYLVTTSFLNAARALFLVLLVLCLYFLLFFKLQSSVFVLLPEMNPQLVASRKDENYPFRVVLPISFAFQLFSLLQRIYHQTRVQLFFIDWEKSRAKIIDLDTHRPQEAPISVWRTILVANEWTELQTIRRTSLELTLIVLLFLLYGCDLRFVAVPIPKAHMAYVPTRSTSLVTDQELAPNLYLRFAIISSLWLLLCIAQRLWKWMIWERFFDEPREQLFVDLCTVAKVSCFVLDETYHGYYLHCRSPYPFADGSMSEIVEQLKQEEAGLTVGRGLDSSIPDCQTFEMFLTRKWKRKYLTLYNAIHSGNNSREEGGPSPRRRQFGGPGRQQTISNRAQSIWQSTGFSGWSSPSSSLLTTQNMVSRASELSAFLKSFIENQDEQFRWRLYRMETCISRFFGVPPDMSMTRQAFFLPDTSSRFCRVLFLGIENDLMLMNILCFTAFDLWLENHAISALFTYLLEKFMIALRVRYGHQNVAKNSLVDPRFLI